MKSDRPELAAALSHLRKGDTLVVWKLDRLGRTLKRLIEMVEDLKARGIHFQSLQENIDTSSPTGNFFFHIEPVAKPI
jgi:DNA invertase Pin-like site-specific DNA recombinase